MCLLVRWLQIVYPEWDCFRNVQFLTRNGMKLSFSLRREAALSLHLSLPLSLCVCSLRFCSGIVWLQRAPARGSNFQMLPLTKFFCCPPWAKTKNNLSALWHTHTDRETKRARERKKDTRNEYLLPQRKLIFSIMWREDKNKVFVAFFRAVEKRL